MGRGGGGARKKPRGEQFYDERRLARQLTPKGLYEAAHENHPSQSEFGTPEFIDALGNEYRLATSERPLGWAPGKPVPLVTDHDQRARTVNKGDGVVRLWVRIPHGSGPNGWTLRAGVTLTLQPVVAAQQGQTVHVISATRRRVNGRTGSVQVTGFV